MKEPGALFFIFDYEINDIGYKAMNMMLSYPEYYLIRMLVGENLFSQIEFTC